MPDSKENIHAGHRQRLKARFLREDIDNFDEHTIIELLLFFGIPYKDTNVIAHELLSRFGSLSNILEARYDQLLTVDGVGENAATLIKLIPSLVRVYLSQKENLDGAFDSIEKLGRMLVSRYRGVTVETVYLMLLDNAYRLLSVEKVYEGSVNSAQISVRRLAEIALINNASMVVLAHNHPSGLAIPSSEDIHTTAALSCMFDQIGAPMLEHILVAGEGFTPIIYDQMGKKRLMPDSSALAAKVDLAAFYGEEYEK
ncbi:MAG: RadC family protein [Clostridia bacterium]|nr:RadC family protein [Clostridia bacterium]